MGQTDAGIQPTLLLDTAGLFPGFPSLGSCPADLTRCWVRSNFIASLDGGATADGKSGGLAGPGDKALFD